MEIINNPRRRYTYSMIPLETKGDILLAFTQYLEENNLPYVIVGDTSLYPAQIDSDVDIVLSPETIKECSRLVKEFADVTKTRLVQILQHESCAFYFILSWENSKSRFCFLALDLCSDYVRNGKLILKADVLLATRIMTKTEQGQPRGFFVPSPGMEFVYYLAKKISKGEFDSRQFNHLQQQFFLNPEQCIHNSEQFWSPDIAQNIAVWMKEGNLHALGQNIPYLQRIQDRKCRAILQQRWFEFERKAKRFLFPTGIIIGLLGPDGCGKSTIGDRLLEIVKPAFRGVIRFHLRPDLGGKKKYVIAKNVTEPHGVLPRNLFMSIVKLLYFLFDYTGGYWLKTRPLQVRSHLVLFDRYFHDILIDPRRYRFGAPLWLARFCSLFIPEPDLFLIFDAPAEVIHARKQEVRLEETKRQRKAYLAFARNRKNCIIIDTNKPVEESVAEACTQILDYLERRTQKRLGRL